MAVHAPTRPQCGSCASYYITHDKHFPHGCRVMGFKSRTLPETEIRATTGKACVAYEAKAGKQTATKR